MDHKEAVRLQAAEKYVLGELAEELCKAYEEHYFDCQECATEVIATAAFVALWMGHVTYLRKSAKMIARAELFVF